MRRLYRATLTVPFRWLYSAPRADVAQLARASACHAEGRGFESLHPLLKRPANAGLFRCSAQASLSVVERERDLFRDGSGMGASPGAARAPVEEGLRVVQRGADEVLEEVERVVGN